MDNAGKCRDCQSDASHGAVTWLDPWIRCLEHSNRKGDTVSSHVSEADETDSEETAAEKDCVLFVVQPAIDVLKLGILSTETQG